MDKRIEETANQQFRDGHYKKALHEYNQILQQLPSDVLLETRINLLFNRSACYLKLVSKSKVCTVVHLNLTC